MDLVGCGYLPCMHPKPKAGPGVHPDRHSPHQLHPWVLAQHQVWVDAWGTEHEIEVMPGDYVQNVLRFCLRRASQLYHLAAVARLPEAWQLLLEGKTGQAQHLLKQLPREDEWLWPDDEGTRRRAQDWLAEAPLVVSLRRRLAVLALAELPLTSDADEEE